MINQTSWGVVPVDVVQELIDAPFGKAKAIINRYDQHWGKHNDGKKRFQVTLRFYEEVKEIVEADDLAMAGKKAKSMYVGFNDIEVIEVEAV
jgi:hypothetical protein